MPKARTLMIQGTGSGVGKSILTAAFCRIFRDEGWRVAPFKAQNMSNNSFVASEGGEMGRAQVMQAECAGVSPSIHMNPVLLKPTGETGSQVIVHGRSIGTMNVRQYYSLRRKIVEKAKESFTALTEKFDMIIIEGAGSPAEINLRKYDFVNMGMARWTRSPVLITGDIERGGVFASLYGTHALLTPSDRKLVKGFIINKFRGDVSLLDSGLEALEKRTKVPVLGVVPYLHGLLLDEEDSLRETPVLKERTDIVIIDFPRLSNATDFQPLSLSSNVHIRYVSSCEDFGQPDLVILPGTKNTIDDLIFLRKTKLDQNILRFAASGGILFGVCGGFQMMGEWIQDTVGAEGGSRKIRGLGLFPFKTEFSPEKVVRETKFLVEFGSKGQKFCEEVQGYEIHMGKTFGTNGKSVSLWESKQNVFGTYLHGLFENDSFRRHFLAWVFRNKKGNSGGVLLEYKRVKEESYQRLAASVKQSVDLKTIRKMMRC